MTPQQFVLSIRREILEVNLSTYRENVEKRDGTGRKQHWPGMVEFCESLNEHQRRQFMTIIRQVMVDTLSNVFGILDGSTLLESHRDYFHLTYGDESQEINGELQDLFLSSET
jgi:hypothetical protein